MITGRAYLPPLVQTPYFRLRPSFGSVGAGNTSSSTPSTLSETHTIVGNCVVVAVATGPTRQTATCTVGGTAMINVGFANNNNVAANGGMQILYLLNSGKLGSQTITASWVTAPTNAIIGSVSIKNVTLERGAPGSVTGTGAAASASVFFIHATNGLIVQAFSSQCAATGVFSAYSGGTSEYNATVGTTNIVLGYASTLAAANTVFGATCSGSEPWSGMYLSLT